MERALIFGSTVADIVIHIDHLPDREGDVHVQKQSLQLGGCAFNVAYLHKQLGLDSLFVTPVGSGIYGQFVQQQLSQLDMESPIKLEQENGCCYCLVDKQGERTFLSYHGIEYSFDKKWFETINLNNFKYFYLCGLEVEEPSGLALVQFLSFYKGTIVYAPGPRGHLIDKHKLELLFQCHPIIHLNQHEICEFTQKQDLKAAMLELHKQTQNIVIVTLGPQGAIAYDGEFHESEGFPKPVIDTIGAGDSHVSAIIAGLCYGLSLEKCLSFANRVSSEIVRVSGVHLNKETTKKLKLFLQQSSKTD